MSPRVALGFALLLPACVRGNPAWEVSAGDGASATEASVGETQGETSDASTSGGSGGQSGSTDGTATTGGSTSATQGSTDPTTSTGTGASTSDGSTSDATTSEGSTSDATSDGTTSEGTTGGCEVCDPGSADACGDASHVRRCVDGCVELLVCEDGTSCLTLSGISGCAPEGDVCDGLVALAHWLLASPSVRACSGDPQCQVAMVPCWIDGKCLRAVNTDFDPAILDPLSTAWAEKSCGDACMCDGQALDVAVCGDGACTPG